jgi:hydroxymethylbilane synthase
MSTAALRLGTRGSRLALWQAEWVQAALARHGVQAELIVIKTQGDAEVDRPLHELEGKGFFTKEIEDELLAERIDAAVHSLKDLPTQLPDGLALGAVPARADPAEALVTRDGGVASIAALPGGAKIGTSSLRRVAQVRYLRPDLEIVALRGNVPTRVQKVAEGRDGLAAALLAAAGLERLELGGRIAARLDPLVVMPAPGQGALGLEVRRDDRRTRAALAPLADPDSGCHVAAERSLLAALGGGCQAPVAAWVGARDSGLGVRLFGRVTALDGSVQITASAEIDADDPAATGVAVAGLLAAQGASRLLAR